jgi:hypothetical protein
VTDPNNLWECKFHREHSERTLHDEALKDNPLV